MLQHFCRALSAGAPCTGRSSRSLATSFRNDCRVGTATPRRHRLAGQKNTSRFAWQRSSRTMASSASDPTSGAPETVDVEVEAPPKMKKLVVFGGNGFVGSRVCEAGVNKGLAVVSVNRSGRPSWLKSSWGDQVEWVEGDCLEPSTYTETLKEAVGVVSCVGGFGSNEAMYKICGETNIRVAETAAAVGVPRFAFISVHEYNLPGTSGIGYFKGKKAAEATIYKYFGNSGVFLRPGLIHGTRYVNNVGLPLGSVFGPLETVLNLLPNKQLSGIPFLGAALVPPVSAEAVGKAAVAAATDETVPGGEMDVWAIAKYS
ncbi:hypothetical protein BSKO_00489 [Bryopsis sp. KO-2023]|nr:hypothetical protein BSKO_00489 [Bryopsis sp. KO-2023]